MKKTTAIILALVMCLAAAGCAGDSETPAEDAVTEAEAEVTETPEKPAESGEAEETDEAAEHETASGSTEVPSGTVEITMDNYLDYFELREAAEPYTDENGGIVSWDFGCGLFLKDEFKESFVSAEVNFEVEYDEELRAFKMLPGSFELGDVITPEHQSEPRAKTFALQDFRNDESVHELSSYYGAVAGCLYSGGTMTMDDGTEAAILPANMNVLHAEGSITFK